MTGMMKLVGKNGKTYVPYIQEDSKKHKRDGNKDARYKNKTQI